MKVTSLIAVFTFCMAFSDAQSKPELSAATKQYLHKTEHEENERSKILNGYVYRVDAQNNIYISAIIQVQDGFNADALQTSGVKVNTKAGDVWTVQVPLQKVKDFTELVGIKYIDMDMPIAPLLDSARVAAHVDSVHSGYNLPQPYTGKNVVVGIIDAGFDYTHPAFYDTVYQTYRVKKVWEEKLQVHRQPVSVMEMSILTLQVFIQKCTTASMVLTERTWVALLLAAVTQPILQMVNLEALRITAIWCL